MEGKDLRKADIITSAVVFLFGVFILVSAFHMPMKDSWGGVNNVWYVSPALFPLIIGGALVLLSLALFRFALKELGVSLRVAYRKEEKTGIIGFLFSEKNIKFTAILTMFVSFVYMYIPRIDFFLSMWLFLAAFITFFYYERLGLLKKLLLFYSLGSALFAVLFFSGLDKALSKAYYYAADLLLLLFILVFAVYAGLLARGDRQLLRRYRVSMIVSLAAPLFLIPVFKYGLRVVLPREGAVVELMNIIRYTWF